MLDFIVWNADPVLLSFGPLQVRWYGLAFAIGFFIGYKIVERMFRHEGAPERWLGILLAYLVVGTIVGALTCWVGLIFGILGIIKANSANEAARLGLPEAYEKNANAKTMTIVSLVLGGISVAIVIIYLMLLFIGVASLVAI